MKDCVQVISREIVKPSSQTQNHLKRLKLSYLDQLMPPMYVPIIFFYQADESKGLTFSNHVKISQHLKHSLSDALTVFYPLAGRFDCDDNVIVDCNDAGVEFIGARVHAHLMDVIENPIMEELKQYIPIDPTCAISDSEKPLVLMQITFFDCGGIALCVCFSHLIADCKSIMAFINTWADTCREGPQCSKFVSFNLDKYFPTKEIFGPNVWGLTMSDEKFTTKRFVFHKEILARLKQDAISSSKVKDPSRVELVSAFIWKHCIEVAKCNDPETVGLTQNSRVKTTGPSPGSNSTISTRVAHEFFSLPQIENSTTKTMKPFVATHLVNLRAKKVPTHLLENVFGNCLLLSFAIFDAQHEGVEELQDMVGKLRSAIRKIDDEYITKAQSGDDYLNDLSMMFSQVVNGELECCIFSSWCRFPYYEVDYGFGKPFWLCTTALPMKNLTILVDSKCGENIEAWVNMEQHNLDMLQNQIHLMLQSSSY